MRTCGHCGGLIPEHKRCVALYCSARCRENNRNRSYAKTKDAKQRWAQKNPDYQRKYRITNLERLRQQKRDEYASNPVPYKVRAAQRKKRVREATPNLTSRERAQIAALYEKAIYCTKTTGVVHHVDHIKPLSKGGIHHPSNLRVVPWRVNLRKGTKYWEDAMPVQLALM